MESTETLSHIPPSTLAIRLKWDVFLSFRGVDTRDGFTTSLFNSLKEQNVRSFMDAEGMQAGDEISPTLIEAIEDSAAAIAVISPRYAESHWCLEELYTIFQNKKLVLPVFYEVKPRDVRKQGGPFEEAFRVMKGGITRKRFYGGGKRWRKLEAFRAMSLIEGW